MDFYWVMKPPKALAVLTYLNRIFGSPGFVFLQKKIRPEPHMHLEVSQPLAVTAALPGLPCTV